MAALTPVASGVLLGLYVTRVGGDYMHARMLLPVLICLLLPVMVVPLTRWAGALVLAVLAWTVTSAVGLRPDSAAQHKIGAYGISDARVFWVDSTRHEHPIAAEDAKYLPGYVQDILAARAHITGPSVAVSVNLAWVAYPATRTVVSTPGALGFPGLLLPRDEILVDDLGLAGPLAAHTSVIDGMPAGHQKQLAPAWTVADAGAGSPAQLSAAGDEVITSEEIAAARLALARPEIHEMLDSVRAPLTFDRFWQNLDPLRRPRPAAVRPPPVRRGVRALILTGSPPEPPTSSTGTRHHRRDDPPTLARGLRNRGRTPTVARGSAVGARGPAASRRRAEHPAVPGRRSRATAPTSSRKPGDGDYLAAVKLFVAEEQNHARMLAELLARRRGAHHQRAHWSDTVFVRLRRALGLRLELMVLLIAEVVALRYYRALRDGTDDPLVTQVAAPDPRRRGTARALPLPPAPDRASRRSASRRAPRCSAPGGCCCSAWRSPSPPITAGAAPARRRTARLRRRRAHRLRSRSRADPR